MCCVHFIYRCWRFKHGCHGRLHLSRSYRSVVSEESADRHNHSADAARCVQVYSRWKLKSAARASTESTSAIIATQLAVVPHEIQGSFPKHRSLQRVIQRSRTQAGLPDLHADTRAELPNLAGIFKTNNGEDFLKWDSGRQNDRILMFSTEANLDCLQRLEHLFADGTFKAQPTLFDQLFVIHGLRSDGENVLCVPLVFCLTPNRTTATYKRILEKLKELRPGLAPISIMTDFEQALLNSFASSFPDVDQRGCFFHFRQANYRHIQSKLQLFTFFFVEIYVEVD
jgi:MULE transposase-like protein